MDAEMKTALITGHKGFIGSHLEAALNKLGVETVGLDIKTGQNILSCHVPSADFCFHLAAQTDMRCADVQSDARINITGTLRMLDYFGDKLIYASCSVVTAPDTAYAISKMAAENYVRLAGGRVVRLCHNAAIKDTMAALIEAPTKPRGTLVIVDAKQLA